MQNPILSVHKHCVLIGALALILGASAHADHIKVFLLGGQSNMQGNNALLSQLPPNLQPPQDDVLLYSGTNFDKKYPQWKGRGYEIAGFGWWQGHKDGGEQGQGAAGAHALRYEHNLVHLIKTLRKEFNAPDAPFVVATCGFNGGEGWEPGSSAETIFNAQMNISDPAKHPDLAGTVKSVDTRPFYRKPEVSPRNQGFHYHGNAETYMLVGEAMGKAIVEMQKK